MAPSPITEASIPHLVDQFYTRVRKDPLLGPVFETRLAGKWQHHLPRIVAFWTKVLLGTGIFQGNVYGTHMALSGIEPEHFMRWLELFRATTIELYGAEHAAAPIAVAERIAGSLQLGFFGEIRV